MMWRDKPGTVYFLRCKPFGPIKVGFTQGQVYSRVRALEQTTPHELEWIGAFAGTPADETEIKRHLKSDLIRNEWFHPTPAVLRVVEERCPGFDPIATRDAILHEPLWTEVRTIMRHFAYRRGHVFREAIERNAGIDIWHVYQWTHEGRTLSRDLAERVAAAARIVLAEDMAAREAAE